MPTTSQPNKDDKDERWMLLLLGFIYNGTYTETNLPQKLYDYIIGGYQKALLEGFGVNEISELKGEELELYLKMNDAIIAFAGFKTFQFVKELNETIYAGREPIDKNTYKTLSKSLFAKFVRQWQKAEVDTVLYQAKSVKQEIKFRSQISLYPYLEYVTAKDEKVCPVCGILDGTIRKVNDPFWFTNSPPRHAFCRCRRVQRGIGTLESSTPQKSDKYSFDFSAYQNGSPFPDNHPYYSIPIKYTKFANNNFGLKKPK